MTIGKDKTMQYEKWRLVHDSKNALVLYRSFRFWKWVLIAMLPAIAAIVVRASTNYAAGPIIGGAFVALGIAALLVHSFLRRGVISNMGVFLRDSDPIPYWLSIVFLLLFYAFAILGILKGRIQDGSARNEVRMRTSCAWQRRVRHPFEFELHTGVPPLYRSTKI